MTLQRGTELPLRIHTGSSNTLMLINMGATVLFIDIDYVWSKELCTQHLPRAISIYNVGGNLNKASYITEVVDLIVQYGGHSEQATFHVTSIG